MATYVTKTDESKTVGTITYNIGRGYRYTCAQIPMSTGYYWSKTLFFIVPSTTAFEQYAPGNFYYDSSTGLFYIKSISTPLYPTQQTIWENEGSFEIVVKNGTSARETVSPSVDMGSWQTKLKCNSGKSYLTVDYPTNDIWEVWINDVLYMTTEGIPITPQPQDHWLKYSDWKTFHIHTNGQGIGEYGVGTFVELPVASVTSDDFEFNPTWTGKRTGHRTDGAYSSDAWASIKCDGDTVVMSSNCGNQYDLGSNECSAKFSIACQPIVMQEMFYQYQVDTSNLQGINVNQLQFQASELDQNGNTITWTGTTSNTIRYLNSNYYKRASLSITQKNNLPMTWTDTATPPFNYGATGWEITQTGTIPTQIGGVKCLNPQLINDYVQSNRNDNYGQGDIANGTDDNIRNTIVKIEPTLEYTPIDMLNIEDNKTIAHYYNWTANYCTIANDTVIVTPQDLINAKQNGTYPTIYQDFERLPYAMENYTLNDQNIPTAEYRQRHWTKCRYVSNPIEHPSHTVFPIRLICKKYGEDMKKDQIWILGRDMLTTINGKEYFDQILVNNHKVQYESDDGKEYWYRNITSNVDEYMSQVECEKLQIWDDSLDHGDEGYGALYYEEKPITEAGYLPNIVGRIEIRVPVGTWHLYDMKTKKSTNSVYCKDEFQQPTNCGFRMPKEYDLASMDYDMNRYIVGLVDDLKSFEIPQTAVTHSAQYQVDWWQAFSYGQIKNGTIIYPRDDIGEITFASQTYTPDANGNLPISNITDNDENCVYWLKPNNENMQTKVRVDYIKGEQLYRYIGGTQNHIIKLVTEYGGLIHGNSFTLQGEYTDTSPYHHSMRKSLSYNGDYYANQNVGTKTTVDLRNFTEKTVLNPNDCDTVTKIPSSNYVDWAENEMSTRYNATISDVTKKVYQLFDDDAPQEIDENFPIDIQNYDYKIEISAIFTLPNYIENYHYTFDIPQGLPDIYYVNGEAIQNWALAHLVQKYEELVYSAEIQGWIIMSNDGNETVIRQYTRGDSSYQRLIDKVIDGGKYWFSYIYRNLQGKIWRNSFGEILRNNEDYVSNNDVKILQGKEQQPTRRNI